MAARLTMGWRALWAVCALACAPSAMARQGFEARCEAELGKPSSELVVKGNGYSVDNSLSYAELTRMQPALLDEQFVLGLTRAEAHVALGSTGRILTDRKRGRECMTPRVHIKLWYSPIVIYVGREFAPGTCAYDAILAHEKRHMAAYLEHIRSVGQALRADLDARLGDKPMYAASGQAFDALSRDLEATWEPRVKAEMDAGEAAQAAIDSAEEYARLSKVCEGEVQSILDRTAPLRAPQQDEE